jgi:hypothetical protein
MTNLDYAMSKYRYSPEDFRDMPCLYEDLTEFYGIFERYSKERTQSASFDLRRFWFEQLFFTIKHREVEGSLTQYEADEIREYLEDLIYAD